MQIISFDLNYLPAAAALFGENFKKLRQAIPELPGRMEDPAVAAGKIAELLEAGPGLAAMENGRLAGYLSWMLLEGFRGTERKAAYSPEWAHATVRRLTGRKSTGRCTAPRLSNGPGWAARRMP